MARAEASTLAVLTHQAAVVAALLVVGGNPRAVSQPIQQVRLRRLVVLAQMD